LGELTALPVFLAGSYWEGQQPFRGEARAQKEPPEREVKGFPVYS